MTLINETAARQPITQPGALTTDAVRVGGDEHTGRSVIAVRTIPHGEVLADLRTAPRVAVPTRFTVQIGVDVHIDGIWQFTFLNHACAPNVRIDTTAMTISAVREIAAGEELGYFYPSTEWQMTEPFDCRCGAVACVGRVTGAADLSAGVLASHWVNAHIAALRAQQ